MDRQELRQRREFYERHLAQVILPYWIPKTDREKGGFFTCYETTGERLVSREKYVWSQGRCTWMYARLAQGGLVELGSKMREQCRELAAMGARFLLDYCILPDGACAFRLSENNQPMELCPGSGFAVSTFADCFVLLGLGAAGVLLQESGYVDRALELFRRVADEWRRGSFRTAPDVLPAGWRSHAPSMILVNAGDELALALRAFRREDDAKWVDEVILEAMEDISVHFISPQGIVHECLDRENRILETVYGRHINPGHTNESMWFLIQAGERLNRPDIIEKAIQVIRHTSALAWDEAYGGMMYYLDREGGEPRGAFFEEEKDLAEAALRDWSSKLWWPHTETIYANLLCYAKTGDKVFWETYQRYHEYTFRTFPNSNREVGEWIQLRSRDGTPNLGQIGGRLPVKDPYHITRNLMLTIALLQKMENST